MLLDSFSHSHLSQSTESQSFIRGFAVSSSRSAVQTLICRISHFVPRRSRLFCSHAKHLARSLLLIWMIAVLMMMRRIRIDKLMITMMLVTIMMIMIRKLIITMMMIMKVMMATSWNHSAAIIRPPLNTTDPSLSVNLHFKNVVEQMYKWDLQRALYYILLHYTTYSRLWNILNFEISQISMIISNTSDLFQCQPSFQELGGVHKMYKWNLQISDNKILKLLKNASTPCHGGLPSQGFSI